MKIEKLLEEMEQRINENIEHKINELKKEITKNNNIKFTKSDNKIYQLWENVTSLIEKELTTISYDTWIKTIKPIAIKDSELILEVPSLFNKGILESRYYDLLHNAIKQVSSREYSICFIISK